MIVIGTAGHIDHGKSSIVKCFTGTNPDRLPEEKLRGMTIDLGFAFYQTPSRKTIAFIDVPGHERFVKNMIAGATGIDAVMLIVSADDGWMQQTEEHFQIVRLLGVRNGIIVINKCDLVDEPALKLLQQEIKNQVKGSFLAEAPILSFSAVTGKGFEALSDQLSRLADSISAKQDIGKARLYIDRVFIKQGIGSVATGTLKDGCLQVGQIVNIWPSREKGKIRMVQTNSVEVSIATPSQRTAVSLTGAGKDKLIRGGALTSIDNLEFFSRNPVLALQVELLNNSSIKLVNKRRALLLAGTSEVEGEIRLLGKTEIAPGQSGIVFFKTDTTVFTLIGDHFILRLPTPMVTLGGGVVLDHLPSLPRQKNVSNLEYLQSRNVELIDLLILSELQKLIAVPATKLLQFSTWSMTAIDTALRLLIRNSQCGKLGDYVYETKTMTNVAKCAADFVNIQTNAKGSLKGVSLDEIRKGIKLERDTAQVVVNFLLKSNQLQFEDDLFIPFRLEYQLPPAIQSAHYEILAALKRDPFKPPTLETLASRGASYKDAVGYLLKSMEIYKCGSDFIFLRSSWNEIESFIKSTLQFKGELKIGELRDKFGFSRKYAVPILEETDRIKLTKRQGDVRIKGDKFEDWPINF